ncbi:hypothetical protein ONZ45_g14815 [Pleurotus djamor]|nr:hypothetical protein ONZ45_g14815 [Pleurotus djamor]
MGLVVDMLDTLPPFPRLNRAEFELSSDMGMVKRMTTFLASSAVRELKWTIHIAADSDAVISPLSGLNLPHLQTLHLDMDLPQSPINDLFSRPLRMPLLTSLTIYGGPMDMPMSEFERVMTCLRESNFTNGILEFQTHIQLITAETMDELSTCLPKLMKLTLIVQDIKDGGHPGSGLDMGRRDYSNWTLRDLSILHGKLCTSDAKQSVLSSMRAIARCTPSKCLMVSLW